MMGINVWERYFDHSYFPISSSKLKGASILWSYTIMFFLTN